MVVQELSEQQAALLDQGGIGLDNLQTPFPTRGILWFFVEKTKGGQIHLSNIDYGLNVSCFLCTHQAFNKTK